MILQQLLFPMNDVLGLNSAVSTTPRPESARGKGAAMRAFVEEDEATAAVHQALSEPLLPRAVRETEGLPMCLSDGETLMRHVSALGELSDLDFAELGEPGEGELNVADLFGASSTWWRSGHRRLHQRHGPR